MMPLIRVRRYGCHKMLYIMNYSKFFANNRGGVWEFPYRRHWPTDSGPFLLFNRSLLYTYITRVVYRCLFKSNETFQMLVQHKCFNKEGPSQLRILSGNNDSNMRYYNYPFISIDQSQLASSSLSSSCWVVKMAFSVLLKTATTWQIEGPTSRWLETSVARRLTEAEVVVKRVLKFPATKQ